MPLLIVHRVFLEDPLGKLHLTLAAVQSSVFIVSSTNRFHLFPHLEKGPLPNITNELLAYHPMLCRTLPMRKALNADTSSNVVATNPHAGTHPLETTGPNHCHRSALMAPWPALRAPTRLTTAWPECQGDGGAKR